MAKELTKAEKKELQKILSEIERMKKEEHIRFIRPYDKQEKFLLSNKRNSWILGGNRTGKTESGAIRAVFLALGERIRPYLKDWPEDLREKYEPLITRFGGKPTRGWICSVSFEVQRDVTQKKILGDPETGIPGLLPLREIKKITYRSTGIIDTIRLVGGGIIGFKSYDQGREKFQGSSQHWCIAEDQRVLMSDGTYKPIQNVMPGDSVITKNGCGKTVTRKVIAKHDMGEKPVFDVVTGKSPWIQLTEDHEVYVSQKLKKKVNEADKVYLSDLDYQPDVVENMPDSFYPWLGLVLSEGTTSEKKITIGSEEIVAAAKEYLPAGAYIRKQEFKSCNHVPDWHINNWPEFWDAVPPGLAHEKFVPDWVFRSDNEHIALFLRFLFAGDGWASGHTIGYASTSRRLAEDVCLLLRRIGIRSSFTKKKSQKPGAWRNQWWVYISSADHVIKFAERVGIEGKQKAIDIVVDEANRRIESKSSKDGCGSRIAKCLDSEKSMYWKKQNNRVKEKYGRIKGLIPLGNKKTYDLSIEKDHRFFVGACMVSNCWLDEESPKDIYTEVQMRLMDTEGDLFGTMTPLQGMTWVYSDIYENDSKPIEKRDDEIFLIMVEWNDNPYLSTKEKKRLEASMDEAELEARKYGRFIMPGKCVFNVKRIHEMQTKCYDGERGNLVWTNQFKNQVYWEPDVKGDYEIWFHPEAGIEYLISADVAEGLEHGDYDAVGVLNRHRLRLDAVYHGKVEPDILSDYIHKIAVYYGKPLVAIELNNHGGTTISHFKKVYYDIYRSKVYDKRSDTTTQKLGWHTNTKTRPLIIDAIKKTVREGVFECYFKRFVHEANNFIRHPNTKEAARGGQHDDVILMSAILAFLHMTMPLKDTGSIPFLPGQDKGIRINPMSMEQWADDDDDEEEEGLPGFYGM